MFLTRQVLIGVLGVPAAAGVAYNWAFFAGGTTGTGDAGVTTNTRTYDLGDATWASEDALSTAVFNPAGFGDKVNGWIIGGFTGSVNATQNRKYTNADNASMSSTAASTTSVTMQNGWRGACNTTYGWVFGGTFTNVIRRYTISSDTWTAVTATLNTNRGWHAGHNNSTVALQSGGSSSGGTDLTTQDIFTFSTEARSSGTALGTALRDVCATGDQTNSYLYAGTQGGAVYATARKVALATGTEASNFSVTTTRRFAEGAGSDSKGAFAGGQSGLPGSTLTTTREIAYATDTDSSSTALPTATAQMAAFSGVQVS